MRAQVRDNASALLQAMPIEVIRYIGEFVARVRLVALARRVAIAVALLCSWALSCALVDRVFALPGMVRLVMLLVGIGGGLGIVSAPVWSMARRRRRIDWAEAALRIESLAPRFEQRLVTVATQLLSQPELRGSPQMLAELIDQVAALTRGQSGARLAPTAPARRAWLIAGSALLLLPMLSLWPALDLPTLLLRQIKPLAAIAAVTTTRLTVEPGNARVIEGQGIRITARADRLPRDAADAVKLRFSGDGQTWRTEAMTPTADGRYAFSLSAIGHDYHYRVIAGDARSPVYTVRVLRRPAVQRFRMHYAQPSHLDPAAALAATDVINEDGRVEAPAGTAVTMSIEATEPLRSATLFVGGKRVRSMPTPQRNVREAKFVIGETGDYRLELTSQQGVRGLPLNLRIVAIADEPPQARQLDGAARATSQPSQPSPRQAAATIPPTARPEAAGLPEYDDALRAYVRSLRRAKSE